MTWRDYWNQDTPIYLNDRHKDVHYRSIATGIAALVPGPQARVLDFGSGEALHADIVAARCGHLYLADSADLVRRRVAARFGGDGKVTVMAPEEVAGLPDGSLDFIIVNSVVQYLSGEELDRLLALFRAKLGPGGQLLFADIIPPDVGPLTDAAALLRLAARNGFFVAALFGLVRTFFSDYRKVRSQLGLAHYSEADFLGRLEGAGYRASRHRPNLGHNQARIAFLATPR
jgi:SAM-dependent methyltransferase